MPEQYFFNRLIETWHLMISSGVFSLSCGKPCQLGLRYTASHQIKWCTGFDMDDLQLCRDRTDVTFKFSEWYDRSCMGQTFEFLKGGLSEVNDSKFNMMKTSGSNCHRCHYLHAFRWCSWWKRCILRCWQNAGVCFRRCCCFCCCCRWFVDLLLHGPSYSHVPSCLYTPH